MYALVLCVSLVVRFERTRRQAALERERALQRERIELSQAIHDTTAQSAYMIGLGIDAAKTGCRRLDRGAHRQTRCDRTAFQDRHLAAETPDRHGSHIRRQGSGLDPGLARCDVQVHHVGVGGG